MLNTIEITVMIGTIRKVSMNKNTPCLIPRRLDESGLPTMPIFEAGTRPLLATTVATPDNNNPQREQKRVSSEICC